MMSPFVAVQAAMNAAQLRQYELAQNSALGQLNAFAPPMGEPVVKPYRTPEQIREQLEARLAEMEAEANSPRYQKPCDACRWTAGSSSCGQPLLIGLREKWVSRVDLQFAPSNALCGPEKALWEPKPLSCWKRFIKWLLP